MEEENRAGAEELDTPEMVEIHEASREDLKAARESLLAQEAAAEAQRENPNTQLVDPKPDAPVDSAGVKTTSTEPSNTPPSSGRPVPTPEEARSLQLENERLRLEGQKRELFLQRRNTEYGEAKKQLNATKRELLRLKESLQQGLESKVHEAPLQAFEDREKIKEIDGQIQSVDQADSHLQQIYEGEQLFSRHLDPSEVSLDDMSQALRDDGVPEDFIASFRQNPFGFTTPEAMIQLGKRAVERKHLIKAHQDRVILAQYAKSLQEENARLKAKPGQVIANVQRSLNAPPPLTAANGSISQNGAPYKDPTQMSRAERAEYLRRHNEA